jgi:hypothetical protein
VSLIVNNEEHQLRALADTGARSCSSIIIETYTSVPFIKTDDSNTTTYITMGSKFTITNWDMIVTFSLPEFNLKKQMFFSCAFDVYDRSESSRRYYIIIGNKQISSWTIRHNHELQ